MKRKIVIWLLIMILCVSAIFSSNIEVRAEDSEDVEFETLLTEDALIGHMDLQTWGVYLASGFSTINDAGGGKIGVGGITNAAYRCTVSTNTIVERYKDGSWVRVTSYTTTNTNALTAVVSKTLSVGSGYYYRVRSVHRASTDASNSCTSSLYM